MTTKPEPYTNALGWALETPCERCHASGEIWNEAWRLWTTAWEDSGAPFWNETDRETWESEHPMPSGSDLEGCPDCDGSGLRPTEAGRSLVAFLRRHLKATL
mgnify:CR=1 FL=1